MMNASRSILGRFKLSVMVLSGMLLLGGSAAQAQKAVVLFAAASTTDAVRVVADSLLQQTGIVLHINPASSSTLARQIDQGAPADLYLSANELWMDWLEERGGIREATRIDLLENSLVLVASADASAFRKRFADNPDLSSALQGRLALGDPSHVPAGMYAKQALISAGWWNALKDRLAPGANVRDALHFIESGEVEAGIVYRTDALYSSKVTPIKTLSGHDPIVYPLALTAKASEASRDVYLFLQSETAAAIFKQFGFIPHDAEER